MKITNTDFMENAKEVFDATERCLLQDAKPSVQLRLLAEKAWPHFGSFEELLREQKTEQSPVHHPEGNVWEHTLLVVDEAAKRKQYSTDSRAFMWAALLHDIGKPSATRIRKGRITAYDHDKTGAVIGRKFLIEMTGDSSFAEKTAMLVRYHMQILFVGKGLPFQDISGMKKETNIADIALLGYCDRLGRAGVQAEDVRGEIEAFMVKCDFEVKAVFPW